MTTLLRAVTLTILMLCLSACSLFSRKVAPYEREILAKPSMALLENPVEEMGMQHMFNAREGSVGGFGGAGGGCGCN